MATKAKLELTWIGKEEQPRLEPRVLLEDPAKSHHATNRVGKNDVFDNRLIFGDNLLALKALVQEFAGKIKCIYIDPPYNTGSAFTHYDDGVEHSLWLSLIRNRLELLRDLLCEEGSIWINLDDNEAHYAKVLCDEVFGRRNYLGSAVWQKTLTKRNDAQVMSAAHDYIISYGKSRDVFRLNRLASDAKKRATYTNRDNDPRGDWLAVPLHAPEVRDAPLMYEITLPSGRVITPPPNRHWSTTRGKLDTLIADNRIWFGRDGNGMPQRKKFWAEDSQEVVPWTWWPYSEVGENREANKEAKDISRLCGLTGPFSTPKPERLIQRILHIATNPGDIVLDSFAGSGTTGAVAHKMGRKWIMVELGDHCHTHIIPRLKIVIDGEDPGGITDAVSWKGGGGFRYYSLAPSLLQKDQFGNWIINKQYNAPMLAQAICKIEGFVYCPSDALYWQHGRSSESDFIYITTQTLTRQQIEALAEEVGQKRSLIIYCHAFRIKNVDEFLNLTIKKIPKAVLAKCEWGKDDYSLEIKNLKLAEPETATDDVATRPTRRRRRESSDQQTLFAMQGGEQ